jgi:hypothetical protein
MQNKNPMTRANSLAAVLCISSAVVAQQPVRAAELLPKTFTLRFDYVLTQTTNARHAQIVHSGKQRQYDDMVRTGKISRDNANRVVQSLDTGDSERSFHGDVTISRNDKKLIIIVRADDDTAVITSNGIETGRYNLANSRNYAISRGADVYNNTHGFVPLLPADFGWVSFLRNRHTLASNEQGTVLAGDSPDPFSQVGGQLQYAASEVAYRSRTSDPASTKLFVTHLPVPDELWTYSGRSPLGKIAIPSVIRGELFMPVDPGRPMSDRFTRVRSDFKLRSASDAALPAAEFDPSYYFKENSVWLWDDRSSPSKVVEFKRGAGTLEEQLSRAQPEIEVTEQSRPAWAMPVVCIVIVAGVVLLYRLWRSRPLAAKL